ncbi:alpha/beta hydrolase [Yoonia sp.]|uniref:alpha/beta fold hydrolase n=1 Tax=Yoonia sp. TaxID=2212373 RepID=UPI0025EB8547|nr:alpha/beta hydrolase [Yoonia sp.]
METAPFFDDIVQGPVGGAAHWLKTADGVRIRVGHWNRADAKGTVVIFPGRTEYVEKYGPTAQGLHDRGYATLAIDWRGQGIADRLTPNRAIGHVSRFADYQNDVSVVMTHLAALGLPKPYFMIGHSMGGCIGLRSLMHGIDIQAAMFSAPMWGILMSAHLRPFAWGLSSLSRTLGFDQALAPGQSEQSYVLRTDFAANMLTTDQPMFDVMRAQLNAHPDLGLGGPSLRWLNTSLREMQRLSLRPTPHVPCLTFLGGQEAIVDPRRIRNRMANWPAGTLRVIDSGLHEMLMDTPAVRTLLLDETVAYFDAHR